MYGCRLARGASALASSYRRPTQKGSLVVARVIATRDSVAGVHEFSISFLCHPGQHTHMLRAQLSLPGEGCGMSSTPETERLACTSAVSRFNTARGSIPICYRAGKSNVEITAVSGHKSHFATVGTNSDTLGFQRVASSMQVFTHCFRQTKGVYVRVMVAFWVQKCKETERRKGKIK